MKKSVMLPVVTILLAAAILLGLSFGLNGIAAANAQEEHLQMMRTVLPDSVDFTLEPYAGDDANIRSVHKAENGFVVETVTYGYAGEITMLIGVNNDGFVTPPVYFQMQGQPLQPHSVPWQILQKPALVRQHACVCAERAFHSSVRPNSAPLSDNFVFIHYTGYFCFSQSHFQEKVVCFALSASPFHKNT